MPRPSACGLTVRVTKRPASNILSLLPTYEKKLYEPSIGATHCLRAVLGPTAGQGAGLSQSPINAATHCSG
jgi:hypothetical protein